jgi:hypothetical protein
MSDLHKYPVKNPDAAWRVIDQEAVIVVPAEGLVRVLNETGARIWELSDGNRSVAQIGSVLAEECDVPEQEAVADALAFLEECSLKGLVTFGEERVS